MFMTRSFRLSLRLPGSLSVNLSNRHGNNFSFGLISPMVSTRFLLAAGMVKGHLPDFQEGVFTLICRQHALANASKKVVPQIQPICFAPHLKGTVLFVLRAWIPAWDHPHCLSLVGPCKGCRHPDHITKIDRFFNLNPLDMFKRN